MSEPGAAERQTISIWLRRAQVALQSISDSAHLDAQLLLAHVLELTRAQLYARTDQMLAGGEAARFKALVAARAAGQPVAYLVGRKAFWTFELRVDRRVLVPRPETELLVELALAAVPADADPRVVDLGTGSGAIAIALALERPNWHVLATDRDLDALALARDNANRLAGGSIGFASGEWFAPLGNRRFDLVVCNPPYVCEGDPALARLAYEPRIALAAGADGLRDLERIVAGAPEHLQPGGWLLLEHGYDQAPAVRALCQAQGLQAVSTHEDLAGLPRVTCAQRPYHHIKSSGISKP